MSAAPKLDETYTYADYLSWPVDERWELINGKAYAMSPAPSEKHQSLVTELLFKIRGFLEGKPCKVYTAPFDVKLDLKSTDESTIDTVVQPDLLVVCDKEKINKKGCNGAPDFIIEILSESTAGKDLGEKLELYQKHGVKEYWIVDPWSNLVVVHIHNGVIYEKAMSYNQDQSIKSKSLVGLEINLTEIFREQ